ncbi:MAG: hypothetical protein E7462_04925 [Ruminococcaceae bacterium]|nr:hypothetical protein [Oscillospiraceae bacterium]
MREGYSAPAGPVSQTDAAIPNKDVTQRVRLEDADTVSSKPNGSSAPNRRKKPRGFLSRKEKITLISLASATAVLIIAAIILVLFANPAPEDDGLILKGVVAAGVNLGGMTPEEATTALETATKDTYSKLDMTVQVLDSQITLSPEQTGAQLDIAAVVRDAYNYGRTGSRSEREQAKKNALSNSVIIPITSYLNLNTAYIRSEINKLGEQFSSTLEQGKITLSGNAPADLNVQNPDTTQVYQTLHIYVGTAEYGLDTNKLFNQVLEYYNINIFQVVGTCNVVAPDSLDEQLLSYYNDLCKEPIDAKVDPVTYEVTPEIYGYGFYLDEVKDQIAQTPYGTTLDIPLRYLVPNLTVEHISGDIFKDVLGDFSSALPSDSNWAANATLACEKLNGAIIKSGETFSFNEYLGELTEELGYIEAMAYEGKNYTMVMGGGVTHAASVLYSCVLESELAILEHHHHAYAPTFIEVGRDAYVSYGSEDFIFRNSRSEPIQIKATVVNNNIQIVIEGTDSRSYEVRLDATSEPIAPETLYYTMAPDNPREYVDGQQLVAPQNGYKVELYCYMYDKETGILDRYSFHSLLQYDPRDAVVVKIKEPSTNPTDPNQPISPAPVTPGI